ncbi:MAG: signal peptidase I [Actinobacteria bacterium]|nr:MAG: signal peptidase I [Actinomycetota bacterium]
MPRFIPTLPSDRKHIPLLVTLALALALLVSIFYVANTAIKVDGDSMLPGFRNGDRVLITRGYSQPARGDVISFSAVISGKPDELIKRVVALGGDTVEVFGDSVRINGRPEPTTYPVIMGAESFHIEPFTVPAGSVYVLGDNRPVSLDSRFFGPVRLSDVKGKARWIFSPVTRLRRIDAAAGRP